MDERKRRAQQRRRRKKRQMMIRRITFLGGTALAVLLVVLLISKVLVPAIRGNGNTDDNNLPETTTEVVEADPNAAVLKPIKGSADLAKATSFTPGWHENDEGRWYQKVDGTYYADGFMEIDGNTYSFDENGYTQTGWITKGFNDYYFNDNGVYDPNTTRPMLAFTFDDGPGERTNELLDCLEENNAHATFFMLGYMVEEQPETVQRMLDIGCEIGSHSWDHPQLTAIGASAAAEQYANTDQALIAACGQAATVARAPYGAYTQEIIDAVGKPFFTWSLDTLDWSYMDAEKDYDAIMNGDLTDGSIILMHDIHSPSVDAAIRVIPELIEKGYKLVTVSEMAAAKGVTLQNASYSDFWASSLASGQVAGYTVPEEEKSGLEAIIEEGTQVVDTSQLGDNDIGGDDESYDEYDDDYDYDSYDDYDYDSDSNDEY